MNEIQDNWGYEGKINYRDNPRPIIRILDDVNSERDDRGTERDVGQDVFTSPERTKMEEWLLHMAFTYGK